MCVTRVKKKTTVLYILTAKKRKVGSECSLYCSSDSIVSVLAVAKRSKSSPSSFLMRRKRERTALHGPHHAEYTSTTAGVGT